MMEISEEQMQIEIAKSDERMSQNGSSLLRLLQNEHTPTLDLLVRESIQNCLDAHDEGKYVTVNFLTGDFDREKLNTELEKATKNLDKRFPQKQYRYLAIKDSNKTGLTGPLTYKEAEEEYNSKLGNLLKLIYEIGKPQENSGSGGSWGIGKTVYFRVGIGLVIYYSQVKLPNGKFESRLAATLVEDEKSENPILQTRGIKRGIAWWGKDDGSSKTKPETDPKYINKFLSIFGIEPYEEGKTGTTIIIPYIDENELLLNTEIFDDEENSLPKEKNYWKKSLEDYLLIAIQRWYAPRLNNAYHERYLRCLINGEGITLPRMEPVFQIIQKLFNEASNFNYQDDSYIECEVHKKEINIRKCNLERERVGYIAYTEVTKTQLKMVAPNNKPSPYEYFNTPYTTTDNGNRPTVLFTRKPGMIVSYESTGEWVEGIEYSEADKYRIAIFVLDNSNRFTNHNNLSLEEYIRSCEMADHTSWNDAKLDKEKPLIVQKLKSNVAKYVKIGFSGQNDSKDLKKIKSNLGDLLGKLILPPTGFGTKPSAPIKKISDNTSTSSGGGMGSNISKKKGFNFTVISEQTIYGKNEVTIPMRINSTKKLPELLIQLGIESDLRTILPTVWENELGMELPFEIEEVNFDNSDFNRLSKDSILSSSNDLDIKLFLSESKKGIAISLQQKSNTSIDLLIYVKLKIFNKNVTPVFSCLKKEELING